MTRTKLMNVQMYALVCESVSYREDYILNEGLWDKTKELYHKAKDAYDSTEFAKYRAGKKKVTQRIIQGRMKNEQPGVGRALRVAGDHIRGAAYLNTGAHDVVQGIRNSNTGRIQRGLGQVGKSAGGLAAHIAAPGFTPRMAFMAGKPVKDIARAYKK